MSRPYDGHRRVPPLPEVANVQIRPAEWEARFRLLGEIVPNGVFLTGNDGALLYLNRRAQEIAGPFATGAPAGESWLGCIHLEDRRRAMETWSRALESGGEWRQELRTSPEAGARWIVCRAVPVSDRSGRRAGFVGFIEDVTPARRAEQERDRFFKSALDLTATLDLATMRFERVNPVFRTTLGYSDSDPLPQSSWGELDPEDEAVAHAQAALLRQGLPVMFELRHRHREGGYRWVAWSCYPVLDRGLVFALGRPVTEQKKVNEEGWRLAALVGHSGDMIEMADLDGRVLFINAAGLEMLGWDRIPSHATLGDFLPPDRREQYLRDIRARQLVNEGWEGQIEFQNQRSGEVIPVHAKAFAIRNEHEVPLARGFIARDIRDSRRIEAALRQNEKLAAMGRVAATIAHEINNPLGSAVNLAYLLSIEKDLSPKARELTGLLEAELARVAAVSKQILSYYRQDSDQTTVPLSEVIAGVMGAFSPRAAMESVQFEMQLDPEARVRGSLNELRQVMINLVGNAMDAMAGKGGRLRIRLRLCRGRQEERPAGVCILIADSGPGIPESQLRRLFEPFFTTKGAEGVGLGLWVSQEIVHKHRGAIDCRNVPGGGVCFRIFLPVEPE